MCNANCIIFGVKNLAEDEVRGKRVLEVGALDLNGSLRPVIEKLRPTEYIGVDIETGKGVDELCRAEELVEKFGRNSFDLVVANEILEHIEDWRVAVSNLKNICRPGGVILITTRSPGFPYHAYPHDYWRYTAEDTKYIFSDCEIVSLENDPEAPGVFVKIRKPGNFAEIDLGAYRLFSVIAGKKIISLSPKDFHSAYYCRTMIREKLKRGFKKLFR